MIKAWIRELTHAGLSGWNRFWFTPMDGAALAVIRIATGLLLFYSHVIWFSNSSSFFGRQAWLNQQVVTTLQTSSAAQSLLWLADDSAWGMFAFHAVALISAALLTVGYLGRPAAIVSCSLTIAFAQRNPAALYGFDQVLGFLSLYLVVNPGCEWLSFKRRRADRHQLTSWSPDRGSADESRDSLTRSGVTTTIATRLIQLHLCVIYLFAGLAKLKGAAWWTGVAFWGAIANHEYQTIDLTWLVHWPALINLITLGTVFWEVTYCVLIWNRLLRPLVLILAVALHVGIAACFGMITFGTAMIVANIAFVSPALIREILHRVHAIQWAPRSDIPMSTVRPDTH